MDKGYIIGFVLRLWAVVMGLFEKSGFFRLQKWVSKLWKRISLGSFFAGWFKAGYSASNTQGVIYGIASSALSLGRKVCAPVLTKLNKSRVFCSLADYYKNFVHHSVRAYGIFAVSASAVCLVYCLVRGLGGFYSLALCAVSCIGAVAIVVDKSLYALFVNSFVVKVGLRLFEQDIPKHKDTLKNSRSMILVHLAAGLISGCGVLVTGSPLAAIVIVAVVLGGFVIYDYRICIYTGLLVMPFVPTMAVVALVMVSFASFVLKMLFDKSYKFRRTPLDGVLGIFALIMGISSVTSFAMGNSIKIFMVYFAFVLAYYLTVNAVRTKSQLYGLICGMLFAGVAVAGYGIYQHIFGFAEGTTWTDTEMFEDIATRVVSTFDNPNVLGEYLLLLIPIGAGYILSRPGSGNKAVSLVITALLSLCMVYTYSRGNWIGLMVAIVLFFMFYDGRIVWLGVIFALFVPMILPQNVISRFMSIGDTADTSTSYRVYIWMGSIAMLRDYWISGIGLGSEAFNMIYPFYSYSGIVAPHTHNLYLQIITENGIVGLAVFVILIFMYYRMSISSIIRIKGDRMLKATVTGLAAGMFGYLVQGMFDNVWYNYRIVFMFYIILAFTACGALLSKEVKYD